jgi:hypothetical protein
VVGGTARYAHHRWLVRAITPRGIVLARDDGSGTSSVTVPLAEQRKVRGVRR